MPVLVGVATLSESEAIAFVLVISDSRRVEQMRLRNPELDVLHDEGAREVEAQ